MINGNFACNNSYLDNHRAASRPWDFQGFVMSDYGALHRRTGALEGTDQEQPFNTYYGTPLETDIENGTIPLSALNTMVQRVLTEMFRFNLFSQPRTGSTTATVTTPAHVALANQVAEAGTTLLKNAGGDAAAVAVGGGTSP